MRFFLVLACVAAASALNVRVKGTYEKADFAAHKAKYNLSYSGREDLVRHSNYLNNVATINSHNAEYDQGVHTWWMHENEFMDWSEEELENRNTLKARKVEYTATYTPRGNVADSKDWREEGAVNAVKNQGSCGSCWAFSAVASLEGQDFLKNGKLGNCAEQQLVDCDHTGDNAGCNGGIMTDAFLYIKGQKSHGIDTTTSYPYTARDGTCSSVTEDDKDVCATVTGYTQVEKGNEDALKDAVANVGPISIAANASPWSFYGGGIFDPNSCDKNGLNHGIAMVGFNTAENYWIIRNSWGKSWGEHGYMRAIMGKNVCGIAEDCCYPNV